MSNSKNEKSWLELENERNALLPSPHAILQLFWDNKIIKYDKENVDGFKNFLIGSIFNISDAKKREIEELFDQAIEGDVEFEVFAQKIESLGAKYIYAMNGAGQFIQMPTKEIQDLARPLTESDTAALQEYMQDKHISASVCLRANDQELVTPDFPENQSSAIFAMHSVGKVFTAMLIFALIREDILSKKDLNRPIQLSEEVKQLLPTLIRERLEQVTLHQLMTHQAGLGDYLVNYIANIEQGKIPDIKNNNDFLPFIENEVYPVNQFKYSNAGILLAGLAMVGAYEKKTGKKCDYNDLLKQYVLNKAGIESFTPWMPKNAKTNPEDKIAPHIVGSPGGGYWISAQDLAQFGLWIYETCEKDPKFKQLIKEYGQEFYNSDRELISHGGAIPSSSAYFSVSLKTGAIIAILSAEPDVALGLHATIEENIIADQSIDITDKEMANSDFGQSCYTANKL